jgi:aryl-alcohol dehydrogenase-like predicted oxidoreductase
VIREYLSRSGIVSIMMQYSLLDRRPEETALQACFDHKVGVITRGTLAKGLLAGKPAKEYLGHSAKAVGDAYRQLEAVAKAGGLTPAQVAIRYALAHPAVTSVVAGASTLAQLGENAGAGRTGKADLLQKNEIQTLQGAIRPEKYEAHR